MMCERALSRDTQGSLLADKQRSSAGSPTRGSQIQQFRLLVMYTAWLIDSSSTRRCASTSPRARCSRPRSSTTSVKTTHIHGALGVSNAMGLGGGGGAMGLVDGPTEVHKFTIARQVLKQYKPHEDGWPSQFKPRRLVAARHRFDDDDPGARRGRRHTRAAFGPVLQQSEVPDDLLGEMEEYLDNILGANL